VCYLHTLVTDPDELGDSCQIKQSLRIEILFKTEEKKVIFTEKYIKSTKVLPNISQQVHKFARWFDFA
jgi:hypothetical protein